VLQIWLAAVPKYGLSPVCAGSNRKAADETVLKTIADGNIVATGEDLLNNNDSRVRERKAGG
jgi:hypothetical protein